jgi:hypothetical protein
MLGKLLSADRKLPFERGDEMTDHPRAAMAWTREGWSAERVSGDPDRLELWCYTDRFSYAPGDEVALHVHSTAPRYSIRILRDGADPQTVFARDDLAGSAHGTPEDAYARGCGWPVTMTLTIGDDWPSGLYLVIVSTLDDRGRPFEREHFFVVRPGAERASIAFILTTSTLIAYNDWGGANHYRGLAGDPDDDPGSPLLSTQRPVARGLLRKPPGAPRVPHNFTPPPFWKPNYEAYSWARLHGYTRHHGASFWATYERPFAVWAEREGYRLDYITQHDLHEDPTVLDGYHCALIVGHDEYWTWEMRDTMDAYVDGGGRLARFAGNFLWQVRLEQDATVQACYRLPSLDPITPTEPTRATTFWDATTVGRPGTATMGLTGSMGVYNRVGASTPRSSGGFTIYRPDHWAFADTDLYFGDLLGGQPSCIASYEVDGVDFTFRRGLPYPTGADGAPDDLEILALAPAVVGESDRWQGSVPLLGPDYEFDDIVESLGDAAPEFMRGFRHGAGMIASFTRGAGEVFNAGGAEWVSGLTHRDWYVERITRNVLDRFSGNDRSG